MKMEIRNRDNRERVQGRKVGAMVKRMFGHGARAIDAEPTDGQIVTVVDRNNNVMGEIVVYKK